LVAIRGESADLLRQGLNLARLDRHEDALAAFDKALQLDPYNANAWVSRAIELRFLNRDEDALVALDKAVELDPNISHAWILRGLSFARLDRDEEALAAYDKAVELNPNQGHTWVHRGISCFHIGRREESIRSFDKAIELGEDFPNVFAYRAEALLALNRWEQGISDLEEALRRFAEAGDSSRYDATDFVIQLLRNARDEASSRDRVKILTELHYRYGAATSLAQALVRSIPVLDSPMISSAAKRFWLETWREIVADKPEFEISLRLLDVAVRYLDTHDQRILLEIPTEERSLLRPLLGIQEAKK